MFCFPLKVSVKRKKRSSFFLMRSPIFTDVLGFSLLSLYVNPAPCRQFIFSLSTSDMSSLCGVQTHGSCFYFLFPLPQKQNFKENISEFKLFPGFNFDGRLIKFQIYSCRGNKLQRKCRVNVYIRL